MSDTNFYMNGNAGSSNLNSGSTCSDVGGGSDAAIYTSTAGNFDGTSVFTPTDGSTPASTVSVGMYAALYNTGDAACRAIAQITTVAAGVNGAITVSTTIKYGTVPTVNSGSRAIKVGGALADLGIVVAAGALGVAVANPQDTILNVKAGTYANTTTARAFGVLGSNTTKFLIRGYKTTPGDQDSNNLAVAGTDIPSFTFTTVGMTLTQQLDMASVNVTSARAGATLTLGTQCKIYRVRATNTNAISSGVAVSYGQNCVSVGCNFTVTSTATTVVSANTSLSFDGCTFAGGAGGIAAAASQNVHILNCVFNAQQGDAISFSTGMAVIVGNTIYAPTGNGILWSGTPSAQATVMNNIFHTVNQASKAAINNNSGASTHLIACIGNAYYNCTANTLNIPGSSIIFDAGTLANDPLPNAASANFTLDPSAWWQAFPGKTNSFENISAYTGFMSPGAVQPAAQYVTSPFPG